MKKRLNRSILAATSLTALTAQLNAEASSLVLTEEQLSTLSLLNQLESSDVTTLDFSNLTLEVVNSLKIVPIDLSKFQKVRNIVLPWFAAPLNITLPQSFSVPLNDSYGRLTIIQAGIAPSSDSELSLNLKNLLKNAGKIILDTKAVPVSELIAGPSVAKIERNVATVNITVADTIEAIDTNGVIAENVKTSIVLTPSAVISDQQKAPYVGLPTAVIGSNPTSLDVSAFKINGGNVTVSGMTNLTNLVISQGDSIGALKVTGETNVTTNATSINKLEVTSETPNQTAIDTMAAVATTVAPSAKEAHIASFVGKTDLDFSKLDLGSVDATATRIKDILEGSVAVTSIISMKISCDVLAAVMTKLSITNLSSFSALKRLDIVSSSGTYQTTTLASADLPSSLEEFYASNLVVRKGTLSADLEFDSKFSVETLDLTALDVNGHALTIAGSFTASSVNTLKLNPSLLAASATKNLISVSASKSIVVSGAAGGALTTTNLQNVGTIDLRSVTGSTSFSAPLNVDGNNSNLSNLYLPSAFDVEAAADILSGVDNGEVTVYLSGAYSGAKTLDASYDKAILNFSGVTGTGRFQLPAGVRGLVLSDAVKGINVGAAAVLNEFDISGLTYLRQLTDLPTSATVLKLNNTLASAALQINLTALTSLTTLQLGSSRISQLSLPASANLTDGGEVNHLNLSTITHLAVLYGLNPLLAEGSITQVSFPNNPASTLHINLVNTIEGIQFNNLDKIPELTVDSDYAHGGANSNGVNIWPTVKSKLLTANWSNFFNYIISPVFQGGINSPSIFDLSGQAIENQAQADALVIALNDISQPSKSVIQKIIIRLDAASSGAIDFSGIVTTDFSHGNLKIIIDQSSGSNATVSVPAGWTAKTKTYLSLSNVAKTTAASWTNYLNYRFASLNDKGEAATSLDLSSVDLTAAQWTALMTALNTFSAPELIQTIRLKLAAANSYSSAPVFTTAVFPNASSIIIDVTDVKIWSTQVAVTGLPPATTTLLVEQRVTSAASVDRTSASSWKGYVEHLLSTISGTNYTLDLTASEVQIQTAVQLTALNSALAGISAANKIKIKNVKLKIATGNRAADFTLSTNFTGFANLASLVVDATDALNGTAQSKVTFSLTNAPAYAKAHVTSLASIDTDVAASWDYYFACRLATDGVLLTNLDVSGISLTAQADLTAFLTALDNQSGGDKSSIQSIKLKLDSAYVDSIVDFSVDLGDGEISGLDHVSFAVEVDRNGANSTAPVSFAFGAAITANNTTIKDITFTGLGSFDGADAHHWLGYVRTLLGTVASGTTTLDLSIHSALEMNNAKVAKFIAGMNALPDSDKAKVATLKIKLASGNFSAATADLSGLSGFSALTSLIVERNGARTSATLYDPAVSVTGSGSVTVNDPEMRSVSSTAQTNQWLGYLRFVLNGMSGVANTVDLSAFPIESSNAATAVSHALASLPASEKLKIQTLKLSASATVTLGTSVAGFNNLTKVIVDQTAAPTALITIAAGTVASGEFDDAATKKFYVTSASTAQTSGVWDKYIDYAMSSVADGGLNQTTFDLTATLDNGQIGQFLTALNASASAANVTALTMKLNSTFGAGSLDLSGYANLIGLGADSVAIYRNAAANAGAPVTVTYGGSFTDSVVQIIDPTAAAVTDTAEAQQWLGYLTGVLHHAASGATLDLTSIVLDDAQAVIAFNAAIKCLDSGLSSKVAVLKLAVSHAANISLGTDSYGFDNLTRIEFTKPATNTVTFADALAGKRTYLTSFNSAKMDTTVDWTRYLNYMLSTTNGGQSASSLNLNSRTFTDQSALNAFFAGLDVLNNAGIYGDKATLTTLRIKLADGLSNIEIGRIDNTPTAATDLAAGLRVIVGPGTSTGTIHAGSNAGEVQASNLIVLDSISGFSKGFISYIAEQGSFAGIIDLTGLNLDWTTGANTLIQELNLLSADTKSTITTINLKLQSGAFGSSTLTLEALTGFTGITFNIDRNGAVNNTPESALVVIVNNTGHTVNLTDAEFHNMSTFDNESSAHWIGYLTHELNSAPASYTLDLSVHSALMLDTTNTVSALNSALRYLPNALKTKVALLKIKSSTNGDIGATDWNGPDLGSGPTERVIPEYAAFNNLASVVIEYNATGLNMGAYVGSLDSTTKYTYVSTPFNGMDWNDWTKFFNYNLNSAAVGGLEGTDIVLAQRLSSVDLTAVLAGLDAATNKALLQNLTLNLASDVLGDINVGVAGLTALNTVTINTNGSAARLTPTDDFYDKTTITSVLNVNPAVQGSWRAYLKDQGSIAAIDIREVELATQAQLTAFLTALNADSRKSNVTSLKIKLAGSYAGTVDFSGVAPAGLTALTANNSVEVHRNGSGAAVTHGGSITNAKIKIVDLTSSSLTDRSNPASWQRYLTALVEDGGFAGSIDLALDSDTYLRTNAQVTAFMTALQNLSPANKLLVTSLKLELASGAAWSNITDLGQGLSGFDNLTSFIVDATGAYTSAGGHPQVTVAFHADIAGVTTKKAIVSSLNSVDKDSQDSWAYFFNSAAMTSVDVSSITLNTTEATAFLAAIGSGVTAKADITSLTMKLDPTFGAASLAINGYGFNITATAFTVHRNGAANAGSPVALSLTSPTGASSLSIVDPTITDADSVLKTSASSWLAYLTYALDGVVTELDLTDDNLALGTVGQATALSTALDALDSSLKAKIATLKVKAAANVTIGTTLTSAAGFSALTAIELNKPVANTITVSTIDATTQLRIADLANVKRTDSNDWLAYIQYLMKDLGAVTNYDLDMTASPLAEGELTAFVDSLITLSQNANGSGNRGKIQKVRLKLAPGAWSGNVTDLGANWNGFMSNIDTFTVDATGATVGGTQLYVGFHTDLTDQSEYTKAFVSNLNSVDKGSSDAWEFYLNHLTKDGPAALDLSGITLSYVELNALDNGLGTFSPATGSGNKLSSIHIKVSGAAGVSNYPIAADLAAQTAINSAAKFIVDVSGFTYNGSQATVSNSGGATKAVELRISGASDLYRNSPASWGMYLNSVYAGGIPATSTVDLTSSSSLYLRSQADVDALMIAIQARSDKANIDTLNVRLAPGSVGSDIIFGTSVTVINPTMNITVTGATNNGSLIASADIHYAGSFTRTGKTVTQAFASTVVDPTVQANWTKYLTYVLSSVDAGGLGHVSIVPIALTSAPQLSAMMGALNGLSNPLKASIQHIHLDVSHANFNGVLALGIGVSGLTNLIQVSYVRASAQVDATAAVVGVGDFTSKIQRLRTAWNADTLASAATVESYLRYKLMDPEMGGEGLTILDLTSQELDNTRDGYLYAALGSLPSELLSRITELRLKFNTNTGGTYSGITLPNLTTVKYFQTGSANFSAPSSNASVTTTRFRALLADVSDKTSQTQWSNYIDYVMTSNGNGGLNQTTLDISSITLTSAQVIAFLAALDDYVSKADLTVLTLKLDPTFGADSLDLSGYSNLDGLGADSVTIHRNAAIHTGAPVTIAYGGSFTDANVKIIDPETNTTADKDNTCQQWLEYLTYTINTVGLTSGLLTIAPGDAFTAQSQIYALFDAMEALDSSLKADVVTISIDLSSITGGAVYLMSTGDVALTGFSNLTKVIYKRGGIDTNIDTIITSLGAALYADATLDAIPTWVRADENARDNAIAAAIADGSIRTAISNADVAGLKSALVTQLASGITFPASDVCDSDVDAAAAAVSVTVNGDVKNTLATALTPFRSTGKITAIETALTTAFTNGGTTGLGTLPWIRAAWAGYADHAAVMTAVLANGAVTTATNTEGQTVANIKTAVANYLDGFLLSYGTLAGGSTAGSLGRIIFDMDITGLANWNDGTTVQKRDDFRLALENAIRTSLETAWPWFVNGTIAGAVNSVFPSEEGFFPVPNSSGNWNATTIKQELFDRLKGIDDSLVVGFSAIKSSIPTMIDAAFIAADSGNALTNGTAAWARPTAGIVSDLTTSIKTALEAFNWYTGNANAQSVDAVTAGDVANQDAATIITNIKDWLATNVIRPSESSIFADGVSSAVDSISLAAASTAVTTDFTGVSETLSRYRVAVSDVSDKDNAGQWTEYLLHKLAPVALGGLGATTIDVSSADLGNDQLTWFWGGLRDGALDAYRANITSIKLAIDNTGGDVTLDGGGKTFNDNLKIIAVMNNKPNNTFTLSTGGSGFKNSSNADLPDSIIDHRITSARTVSATAVEWTRWLNHQLSAAFGGASATTIDLSATHAFTTQAQLNTFFAGLEALDGTSVKANKNVLTALTLKLVAGNFGAASARIGYTGSAAVTNLKADINVTVQRNGARNGAGTESALVTVNHSDIDALSSVDGVTVDNTDAVDVDNLSSSAEWLEYLNSTLTAVGAAYTLDLTGAGLQLAVGTSATESTALMNALQALNPTLKAKIATIKIKLAAGDHGTNFTISPSLLGFVNLATFIVDATGTLNGTAQSTVTFGFTNEPVSLVTKEVRVTALASVDLDRSDSWGYYLNYLKATNGDIVSIDLSTRDLADTDSVTTQPYVDAFFTALEARSDRTTVKDIFLNVWGVDGLNLNVGTGTTTLTALTSVVIRRHAGAGSAFSPSGNVGASDRAIINSDPTGLGAGGTVAQWKGYLAYKLEDAAHGGGGAGAACYAGSPIALNLTNTALQVNSLAVLQAIETAIAELPPRLKARISAVLIKTTDTSVDYTNGAAYEFGDSFTTTILSELSNLKAVIIESCTTGTDPVFDTDGDFFNAPGISKIVYHTTLSVA